MQNKHLKIASISSEVAPYSKTGGLADVARSLPRALNRMSHEIICITPFYGKIINKKIYNFKIFAEKIKIKIDEKNSQYVNYLKCELTKGVPVYFVQNDKFFSKRKSVYGSSHENARFLLFNLATLKLIEMLKFKADIIQCHDWHTGLIPYYLKKNSKDSAFFNKTATIFTIHNLIFQFGHNWWDIPQDAQDDGKSKLPLFNDKKIETINFAKRAILNADIINTVSETHAKEIMEKEKGQDLHLLLRNRKDRFFGIVNGIRNEEYNPMTDPGLRKNFGADTIENKKINKKFLQKKFGLKQDETVPIIVMASRITHQKGFDIIIKLLKPLMNFHLQLLIMGDGDKEYINEIKKYSRKYPGKITWAPFNKNGINIGPKYETSLYAGGDMMLLPSVFEPCGIPQMKALRYGCIPIVRAIGGLNDTITNYNPIKKNGNGFTFNVYSSHMLLSAIVRALETYKYKKSWNDLIRGGIQTSFSWNLPAQLYIKLFKKAIKIRREKKIEINN